MRLQPGSLQSSGELTPTDDRLRSKRQWFRSRLVHFVVFWFAVWPFLAVTMGAINLMQYPTTKDVPFWIAFPGVAAGVLYLIPEFLVSGAILFVLSSAIFLAFGAGEIVTTRRRILECALAYLGVILGIAFEFPSVLNNAFFTPLRTLTLLQAYVVLFVLLVTFGLVRQAIGQRRSLACALLPGMVFVAFGWVLTKLPVPGSSRTVNQGSTVILGIDSLGTRMDIGTLRKLSQECGGAFYEHAVTPGLLTNAVWTAILEHRPVRETGVLLTFQSPDWSRSPFQLVSEAKRRGYQTWSFFTGQNTIYVGSMAGFDHDRSGPMGWLQDATSASKNGSVIVPFIASRLPQLPLSRIPSNQAGTYAYDLRAVVRSIVSSHQGTKPVFAVSHLGYLHDQVYPRFADLPKSYRHVLLGARVDSLQDLSGDWQRPSEADDLIDLNGWKVKNVQAVVSDEIRRSGFLDAQHQNRLVILSDHGLRWRLSNDYFESEGFYGVPLITFGLPVRDTQQPISLLDIPSLIGFDDPSLPGPAAPMVEYVSFPTMEEAKRAVLGAKWTADGRIDVSPEVTGKYLKLLKAFHPFATASTAQHGRTPRCAADSRPCPSRNQSLKQVAKKERRIASVSSGSYPPPASSP